MKNGINTLEDKLGEMLECEKIYKEMYIKYKEAFNVPINCWDEFCLRVSEKASVPESPPSPMMPYLDEKEWFRENKNDVAIVKNARYCPPFFHCLQFIKIVYVIRGSAILFIDKKQLLLSNSDCSIEHIVSAIGYTDVSRFYRNFKKIFGMTPSAYRNFNRGIYEMSYKANKSK